MWIILFGLALAAAGCLGIAAVALAYSKYPASLREERESAPRAPRVPLP